MKKLSGFLVFDTERFLKDKILQIIGVSQWLDFDTKKVLGTKFPAVITRDDTQYKQKDGEIVTNVYEKFDIKVPKVNMQIPINSIITLVNPVGSVYGEYRDKLSVIADDIKVIQQPQTQQAQSTQQAKSISPKTL